MPENSMQIDVKFTRLSVELRTILKRMLDFNPFDRQSAKDLITNKYFENIRNAAQEEDADFEIKLQVDEEDCFDYEELIDNVPVKTYVTILKEELSKFKKLL